MNSKEEAAVLRAANNSPGDLFVSLCNRTCDPTDADVMRNVGYIGPYDEITPAGRKALEEYDAAK